MFDLVNIGTAPDSGDGDYARVAFDKINKALTEISTYSATVPAVADLRLLTSADPRTQFYLQAYYPPPWTRGGGWFVLDTVDVTTPDDGFMCIVDASNRRLKRVPGPGGILDGWMAGVRFT